VGATVSTFATKLQQLSISLDVKIEPAEYAIYAKFMALITAKSYSLISQKKTFHLKVYSNFKIIGK
jgi:hypothetical protein